MHKADLVSEAEGEGLQVLRIWFFANDGFTEEAETLMREKGMLWSVRNDLNELLNEVGLRRLPDLAKEYDVNGKIRLGESFTSLGVFSFPCSSVGMHTMHNIKP
ncbi:MAG: hypothetical protein LWW98_08395 [Deltaproteobacteria bacterium]|nr:hypothetical protein [Deltaproteobacteria bacterium]